MFTVGLLLLGGITIGLGVGLGVAAKKSSGASTSTAPMVSGSPSGLPSAPSSTSLSVLPSKHSILDNTSFAVAATAEGNRHVIFQDFCGAIRDSFYSHGTASWTSTESWIVPANARNHTPLTAVVQTFANTSQQVS